MAIEAIRGAAMTYQGSASTAEAVEESRPKAEQTQIVNTAEAIAAETTSLNTKQRSGEGSDSPQRRSQEQRNAQIQKENEEALQVNSLEALKNIIG